MPHEFPRGKISGEHHTHLRPEEVWEAMSRGRQSYLGPILEWARRHKAPEATTSSLMLYIALVDKEVARVVAFSKVWKGTYDEPWDVFTRVSVVAKAMHDPKRAGLIPLFELGVLQNRTVTTDVKAEEMNKRKNPQPMRFKEGVVRAATRRVLAACQKRGAAIKPRTLSDFIATAWEWAPSGSVHTQYTEDSEYVNTDRHLRNKFVTLCNMPTRHIETMLKRKPQMRAWFSEKYEWGKVRAIYGTDLTSAIHAMYAFEDIEDVLSCYFPIGEEARADRVHNRVMSMTRNDDYSYTYDFADFNSLHSRESMAEVIAAYADIFSSQLGEERMHSLNWTMHSLYDAKVSYGGEWYEWTDTLMSGWRLTTAMNTLLNAVYFELAGLGQGSKHVKMSVHNGDDVYLTTPTPHDAWAVNAALARIGSRAQASKCNFSSEFLRVDHLTPGAEGGAQYITRGVATAVHSRIESSRPLTAYDSVSATLTRMRELKDRGADHATVDKLCEIILRRESKIYMTDYNDIAELTKTHQVCGGLATDLGSSLENVYRLESQMNPGEIEAGLISSPGVGRYITYLITMYKDIIDKKYIINAIKNATLQAVSLKRMRITKTRNRNQWHSSFERALYKRDTNTSFLRHVSSFKRFGTLPTIWRLESDRARDWAMMVSSCADPLRALRVLV
jgi:hypothetical protein